MGETQIKEISDQEIEIARYFAESLLEGLKLDDELIADIRKIPGNGIEFCLSKKAYFFSADFGEMMVTIASIINKARKEET